jgi:hypothetical protein
MFSSHLHSRETQKIFSTVATLKRFITKPFITDEWQKRWSQSGPSTAKRFFPKVNGGGLKKLQKLSALYE